MKISRRVVAGDGTAKKEEKVSDIYKDIEASKLL